MSNEERLKKNQDPSRGSREMEDRNVTEDRNI